MEVVKPYKVGNYWTNLVDSNTGEGVNFEEVTTYVDGTAMSDAKVDGYWFKKLPASAGSGYVKRVVDDEVPYKATLAQLRANVVLPYFYKRIVTTDIGMEGEWYPDFSDTTSTDNTGTIIVNAQGIRIKRVHSGYVDIRWFGAKLDYGTGNTDDTAAWQRAINYQTQRSLKIVFPEGRSLISEPLNLNTWTHIEGQGMMKSEFIATFEGNVLQFLNGYERDPITDEIISYGSAWQGKLSSFGINNNIPVTSDEFGRLTSFCMGTAIHIEGMRYMGTLHNIRIIGGFNKAIYLWGSWGATIDLIDINNVNYGLHSEAAGNGMSISRFFGKHTGNINNGTYGAGGGIYYNGGTNLAIHNSIIENANTSSPAITLTGNTKNFSVRDCYFERQTTANRSLRVLGCNVGVIENCNFENCYGIEISGSNNIAIKNTHVYDNDNSYTQAVAFRIVPAGGLCNDITLENCKVNNTPVNGWSFSENTNYLALNKQQAEQLTYRGAHDAGNRFKDPTFSKSTTGTATSGVTASFAANGLNLTFSALGPSVMNYTYNNVFTHTGPTGGRLWLICRISSLSGVTPKRIEIVPSTGSTVSREIPITAVGGGYFVATLSNVTNGYSYSFRISIDSTPPTDETITVSMVYMGFGDMKNIFQPVTIEASSNTATPVGATYSQAEVQAILTELRDLKTKMRVAGLLAT